MRLSEAILLGSTLSRQAFGQYRDDQGNTCAFGAAGLAIGVESLSNEDFEPGKIWNWAARQIACPACGCPGGSVAFVIATHLNDMHKWGRERIAEWVAKIEPEEQVSTQPAVRDEELYGQVTRLEEVSSGHGS